MQFWAVVVRNTYQLKEIICYEIIFFQLLSCLLYGEIERRVVFDTADKVTAEDKSAEN
jgi:hypothetical protein